jgi:tRNA(Ile)-lysidine synthase TilS/MesJ
MTPDTIICKKCALDSQTPGISIGLETGLCQYCEFYSPLSSATIAGYKDQMDRMFDSPGQNGPYDAIFALSGGVDSSYALYRLRKEYPMLRVLAVQFDNGFISDTAFENAQKICEITKSTYFRLVLNKKMLRDAFRNAELSKNAYPGFAKYRASDMCNTCMSIIKQKTLEMALKTRTPFVIFAFSPGQTEVPFVTLTRKFLVWIRKMFENQLTVMGVKERSPFLIDMDLIESSPPDAQVTIIHPFLIWEYNKHKFKEECLRLGWIEPDINDPNSSNCLLNAYATKNHFDKYHIHSYAYDLSSLVRQGNLEREEAIRTLNTEFPDEAIEKVRQKLNASK